MAGVEGYMQSFVMLNVFMNLPGWLESEGFNFLVMLNVFINLPAWPESDIINFVGYLLKTPPGWGLYLNFGSLVGRSLRFSFPVLLKNFCDMENSSCEKKR